MPVLSSFDYAVIRVVPRVEREEFINVGVILICREKPYLGARIAVDKERLRTLSADLDLDEIQRQLDLIPHVCDGDEEGGEIAQLPISERFHWLQVSPAHSGLTENPEDTLERLLERMVLLPNPGARPAPPEEPVTEPEEPVAEPSETESHGPIAASEP